MTKRYYWLKLQNDFFKSRAMKKLRTIAGGDTYTIIYLKLQLLSLKDEGMILNEGIEDSLVDEIALDIDESVDNVRTTLLFLESCGLAEVRETEINLPAVKESIGSEGQSAARVRKFRARKQDALQSSGEALQCDHNVQNFNDIIEIDIESEKREGEIPPATSSRSLKITHPLGVPIGETRYNSLCAGYGQKTVDQYIQKIIDYADSKGKKYRDYAAAAGLWMSKDKLEPLPKESESDFSTYSNREGVE